MCGCYGLKFHEIVVSSSSSSELSNRSADSQIYRKLSECGLNDPEHKKVVYRGTREVKGNNKCISYRVQVTISELDGNVCN